MNVTTLATCTGASPERALLFVDLLPAAMAEFGISTPARQAAFLAQIGHESGGLRWLTELWGPTGAQRGYEMRADLGNRVVGDGFRYRGRGLIQVTGRANYRRAGDALGLDLEAQPELLAQPSLAARSAGWFWTVEKNVNELADIGAFEAITRRINGGLNGYPERLGLWARGKTALGIG